MAIVKSDVGGNIAVFFSPDPLYMEYGAGTKMRRRIRKMCTVEFCNS
jgi:hypothetical protein